MMKRSTKSISFLMEFIIVILFFALSSAVCVHVYAQAELLNQDAQQTKRAMQIAQNYIETFSGKEEVVKYDKLGKHSEQAYFTLISQASDQKKTFVVKVMLGQEELLTLPCWYDGGSYEK